MKMNKKAAAEMREKLKKQFQPVCLMLHECQTNYSLRVLNLPSLSKNSVSSSVVRRKGRGSSERTRNTIEREDEIN